VLVAPTDERPLWLVVRTKPKQERAVVETLGSRSLEAYCPRIIEPRWHRRAPRGPMPLFPSYVFARCVLRDGLGVVSFCPGVAGVLRFGGELAAVEDEIILKLKEKEGERGYLEIKAVRRSPRPGERVRIESGPLAGLEGIVTRYLPARDRVQLLLLLVSGKRTAEVDAGSLRLT
jgi:transcription antitermination factor NusG